ncbi:hypothetical protein DRO64_10400 [Candidatus Bathyarchaeota archaeon]|nr:MAG: hypothetical protein DRO64_10400 [Candidatus Bathyarchaeota archaeon]
MPPPLIYSSSFKHVKSYETSCLGYFPGKVVKVILVKDVKNAHEIFSELNRLIIAEDCKILNIIPSSLNNPIIDLCYFLECDADAAKRAIEAIKKFGFSKSVMIVDSPLNDLALIPFFPFIVADRRAVIMREPMYKGLFRGFRKRLGIGAAKVFLSLMGIDVGKEAYEAFSDIIKGMDAANALKILLMIGQSFGFCFLESVKVENDAIIVSLIENWEGAAMRNEYDSPQCFFTKGIIEGFLEAVTGRPWDAEEVECLAMGSSRCTFVIHRRV